MIKKQNLNHKHKGAYGEEVKLERLGNGYNFNALWLYYIKNLPKKQRNGKSSFDYIIYYIRKAIDLISIVSVVLYLIIILLIVFRITLGIFLFSLLFISLIITVPVILWLGITNARVTSLQLNILFERGREKKGNRKIKILKYSYRSFYIAILSMVFSILLIENNFILSIINQAYLDTRSFLNYSNLPIKFNSIEPLVFGGELINTALIVFPIFFIITAIHENYKREITHWDKLLQARISERFYKAPEFSHLINQYDSEDLSIANLVLGTNSKTGQLVTLNPETRLFNTFFIGPTGSGKGVAVANNMAIQDSETAIWYFRKHFEYVEKCRKEINSKTNLTNFVKQKKLENELEKWYTSGISRDMLNGFYVNEPTGSLTKQVRTILKKIGIPDEMIWVIDPVDDFTEGVNVLDESIESASGTLSEIVRMFMEEGNTNGNPFFTQAGEAFIRSLVVVVKVTSQLEGSWIDRRRNGAVATLTQINEVIDDTSLLKDRLVLFNEYIKYMDKKQEELSIAYNKKYNSELEKWINNGNKDRLFDKYIQQEKPKLYHIREELNRFNEQYAVYKTAYNSFVNDYYLDTRTGEEGFRQEQYISGLKNVFRTLTASDLAQKILFRTQTKNMDVWLKSGGFIIVNTARGNLDDSTSKRVGKLINKVFQNATLRRHAEVSPLFSQLVDENAWIVTEGTENFANQIRKFHSPMIGLFQNYEQVEDTLGASLTRALFSSYRNGFVFQDGSQQSIDILAEKSGTKLAIKKSITQKSDDILSGNEDNSVSIKEEIEEVEAIDRTELIHQEQFSFTGVYVENNEMSDPTNVVPTEYFYRPIFQEDFKPIFDIKNNKKDLEVFEFWKQEVEQLDEARYVDNVIPLSLFDSEAVDIITGNYDTEKGIYKGKSVYSFLSKSSEVEEQIVNTSTKKVKLSDELAKRIIDSKANNKDEEDIIKEEKDDSDFITIKPKSRPFPNSPTQDVEKRVGQAEDFVGFFNR